MRVCALVRACVCARECMRTCVDTDASHMTCLQLARGRSNYSKKTLKQSMAIGWVTSVNNNIGRNGSCLTWLATSWRRCTDGLSLPLPHEDNVLTKFRIWKERHGQMRKPYQSLGRMKNSSYCIAPVGVRTHDLPQTVASNMVKVSHALNHSATAAVYTSQLVHTTSHGLMVLRRR